MISQALDLFCVLVALCFLLPTLICIVMCVGVGLLDLISYVSKKVNKWLI